MYVTMANFYLIKFFVFFILIFSSGVKSKNNEKKKIICADEIGPVIEFQMPDFDNGQVSSEFFFKLYYGDDRNLYYSESGAMFKKLSPVDNSYFYYKVDTTLKNKEVINLIFEFFPPSTLMLKKDEYMFKTLACWNN